MCGISGILLYEGFIKPCTLKEANKIMKHRGPDGEDIWISTNKKIGFSHVRLSIVDLNIRANQPFQIEDGNYVIIFNGEIYNYLELQKKHLKEFNIEYKTTSDTEVLLYMYKYYGIECLKYLKGMFAFAIYDKIKNQTFIAHDIIGQKPIIYSYDSNGFYFASEIPVLFKLNKNLRKEIDENSMKLFLIHNFYHIPPPYTIFKSIYKLEPSSYLVIKNGIIIKKEKYFKIKKSRNYTKKENILIDRLKLMEPKEVSYGTFLSGGIDSSYICANLKRTSSNVASYTLKVDKNNDNDYKRSTYVSKALNIKQNIINVNQINILKTIGEIVAQSGEPYYHRTSIYADAILKKVKFDSHKVMFTGAGGDEIYYGYNNLIFLLLDLFFKIKNILPFVKFLLPQKYDFISNSDIHNLKQNYLRQNLIKQNKIYVKEDIDETLKYIQNIIKDFKKTVNYNSYIDFSYMFGLFVENSHSLVIQSDLIGMKNSIEIRSLFMEADIVANAYSIPLINKLMFSNLHEGKKILRNYLKPLFSKNFLFSKKIGFGVNSKAERKVYQNYSKEIKEKIELLSQRLYFRKKEILNLLNKFNYNYEMIMKLYALEIWFEKFVDK